MVAYLYTIISFFKFSLLTLSVGLNERISRSAKHWLAVQMLVSLLGSHFTRDTSTITLPVKQCGYLKKTKTFGVKISYNYYIVVDYLLVQ